MVYFQSAAPSISNSTFSLFQEKISFSLTHQQKRVALIFAAAIATLVACYVALRLWDLNRKLKDLTAIKEHYLSLKRQSPKATGTIALQPGTNINIDDEMQKFFRMVPTLRGPYREEVPDPRVLKTLEEIRKILDNQPMDKAQVFRDIAIDLATDQQEPINLQVYFTRVTALNNNVIEPLTIKPRVS